MWPSGRINRIFRRPSIWIGLGIVVVIAAFFAVPMVVYGWLYFTRRN
mgnify:CR=1 FL=1